MKIVASIVLAGFVSLSAAPAFAQWGYGIGTAGPRRSRASQGQAESPKIQKSQESPSRGGKAVNTSQKASSDPVAEQLAKKPKLAAKLERLLPKKMTARQACSGFDSLGHCVAAVHASNNLRISFPALKGKMVEPEGKGERASLGKAIKALKPKANAKSEANRATKQAAADLKGSQSAARTTKASRRKAS